MQGSFPTENKKSLRRFDLKKKHLPCWDQPGRQPAVQHTCEEMEPFPLPSYLLHKGRHWCLMPEEEGMGFITLPASTGLWWPSERENKEKTNCAACISWCSIQEVQGNGEGEDECVLTEECCFGSVQPVGSHMLRSHFLHPCWRALFSADL